MAPRIEQAALISFVGVESAGEIAAPESALSFIFGGSNPFHPHAEMGVFQGWYWNVEDIEAEGFAIGGVAAKGFFAFANDDEYIFGVSDDTSTQYFGIAGVAAPIVGPMYCSEGDMVSSAVLGAAVIGAAVSARAGSSFGGSAAGGMAIASILNVIASSLWVHFTYGKNGSE